MLAETIDALINWMRDHPHWSGLLIFLVAMAESLVVVGVLVPGAAIMVATGTLVALGVLDLMPTLLWASAGAVVGDGISFWLGYHFRDRIRGFWPFSRYPGMLEKGERFFLRHGGKSIFLGRFVGPIRAIIPTVAGIMAMPPHRFTFVNVLSAIAWAPAYILPGVAVGASLHLAADVTGRLIILTVVFLLALWLMVRLVRAAFRYVVPRVQKGFGALLKWLQRHPRLAPVILPLVAPTPAPQALAGVAILLVILIASSTGIAAGLVRYSPLPSLDLTIAQWLSLLHAPELGGINRLLLGITTAPVALSIIVGAAGTLAFLRCWQGLAFFGLLCLAAVLQQWGWPGWLDTSPGKSAAFALFPSLYAIGFATAVAATPLSETARRWLYTAVTTLLAWALLARVYFGLNGLVEITLISLLSLIAISLVTDVVRRQRCLHRPARPFGASVGAIAVLAVPLSFVFGLQRPVEFLPRPSPGPAGQLLDQWTAGQWEQLPPGRRNALGRLRYPFTIQLAGTAGKLAQTLSSSGWQPAETLSLPTLLRWLSAEAALENLPVPPAIYRGRHPSYQFILKGEHGAGPYLLRLWPSGRTVARQPLWLAEALVLEEKHFLLFHFVSARPLLERPALAEFVRRLPGHPVWVRRDPPPIAGWDGWLALMTPHSPRP